MIFRLALSTCVICFWSSISEARSGPAIWLAPLHSVFRQDGTAAGAHDFDALFEPNAAWKTVSAATSVFKIYLAYARDASDDELQRLIEGLKVRNISLAVETPVLADTAFCDGGGRKGSRWMIGPLERIKKLGGDIRYIAMTGPLVDGHSSDEPHACRASLRDVAVDAAVTTGLIRRMFPNVEVGEIEPIGTRSGSPHWSELETWVAEFEQQSGHPLAFFHVDVNWGLPWRADLRTVAQKVHQLKIPFGVILNGNGRSTSDDEYVRSTLENIGEIEGIPELEINQVILQSWADYPKLALSESNPTTFMGMARSYLRPRSIISALGPDIFKLTEQSGRAIANVLVDVEKVGPSTDLSQKTVEGTVPLSARKARFALRLHLEGDDTLEAADTIIADLRYSQGRKAGFEWTWNQDFDKSQVNTVTRANANPAIHLTTSRNEKLLLNGPEFVVVPGKPFKVSYSEWTSVGSNNVGYIALIFDDDKDSELLRVQRKFTTTWQTSEQVKTGFDGRISFAVNVSRTDFRLSYRGDVYHSPAILEVKRPSN